jgi:hypothetical protein
VHLSEQSEMNTVPSDIYKIATPARCLISGPSMAGKSRFIMKLVKYRRDVFANGNFNRVMYCYNEKNSLEIDQYLEELMLHCSYIELNKGVPTVESFSFDATTLLSKINFQVKSVLIFTA